MNQPKSTPTSKVTAATSAGGASVLIVFVAGQLGLDVSPEVAAAVATLLAFAGGYLKKDGRGA